MGSDPLALRHTHKLELAVNCVPRTPLERAQMRTAGAYDHDFVEDEDDFEPPSRGVVFGGDCKRERA